MRRFATALAIVMMLASGCSSGTRAPAAPAEAPAEAPTAAQPDRTPQVRAAGQDLELVGVESASSVVWSPSGHLAVLQAKSGGYLVDAAAPSLTPLPDFTPAEAPAFWSETEVAWMQDGRLQLRDLATGQTRLLHDFGAPVSHFIRPGDSRYVVNRLSGTERHRYQFGAIVTGTLNRKDEKVVIDNGYLAGRMFDGQLLAVAGNQPGGPLWSISPSGEKELLSQTPAHFVQIAPGGLRALWLTGGEAKGASGTDANALYDPPLTDLWTWDRTNPPVRISLGGTFSVQAAFSPDGSRIALALNEGFAGTDSASKHGRVAVVEGAKPRSLASFEWPAGVGMWLGADGFQIPYGGEKTGAQAPINRINLAGKQEQFTHGLWYDAGTHAGHWPQLIMDWRGNETMVYWGDATTSARVDFNPNEHIGYPLYVPSHAPYLPFAGPDRLWLKRLSY